MLTKGLFSTVVVLIAALAIALLLLKRELSISSGLRSDISMMRAEAERLRDDLEAAAEEVRQAEADRAQRYETLNERLRNETPERDGAVAPVLRDLLGGLPG